MTLLIRADGPGRTLPGGPSVTAPTDPRASAFCSSACPEIFHAVAHRHEVWREDPFDVETIHEEARAAYHGLVERATTPPGPASGRVLLLLGESGCGKTHLMRAFRNWAHGRGRAYCGYLQMTTATDQYGRYILGNLIDSLERPYCESRDPASGLLRLSSAMIESAPGVRPDALERLREAELTPQALACLVEEIADTVVLEERFERVDFDLARAMIYLQRDDPRIRGRVLKYLRCEDLSPSDRRTLGDLVPRTYDDAPLRLIEKLGGLMWAAESSALVLCVDQLEDIYQHDGADLRFRRAMGAVCDLVDRVPSAVVVVACLQDFYEKLRGFLTRPIVDRLEKDPEPIVLAANREPSEIEPLIARRLDFLYDAQEIEPGEGSPIFPIPTGVPALLAGQRTRDVLAWCQGYRERCQKAGRPLPIDGEAPGAGAPPTEAPGEPAEVQRLEQAWNDFRTSGSWDVPEDDEAQIDRLVWAIARCSDEAPEDVWFAAEANGTFADVECHGPGTALRRIVVGLCNRSPRGGGLGKQVAALEARAGEGDPAIAPVLVRSSDFPSSPSAQVNKQIGALIARGGRRVVVQDADWRAIVALKAFLDDRAADPALRSWLREERPLGQLRPLRTILDLDRKVAPTPAEATPTAPPPRPERKASEPEATGPGPLLLGRGQDRAARPVEMDPNELTRHAAFLGGSGSGKTTAALSLVEQLLLRGIPALLVDRKGDLCNYADPHFGSEPDADPVLRDRVRLLRERVDVALYTPGNPAGRPLSIAVAPEGLGRLPGFEREQVSRYAARGLGGMMNYSAGRTDQARLAILARAIGVLAELQPDRPVTLEEIIALVHEQDPMLVAAVGLLEPKHFARLVQDLETLRLGSGTLLGAKGERLDVEAMLGLGAQRAPGRTRLGIVSTKFLGSNADVQFWVAQLLVELSRWASRSPADRLQAVVMFDEADLYLPAQKQPPTKEPMEDLLKRARSAGLGIVLATQSPGDLDYKCRDTIRNWMVGRVKESTALAKLRPMLAECRTDVESRLPTQGAGQFHLLRDGDVTALLADRNAVAAVQRPEERILELARGTRRG